MPTSERTPRASGDSGLGLVLVVVAMMVVTMITVVLVSEATAQHNQAELQKRDDVLVANAEAVIDRYAAKLTIDPQYYLHRVDESERARTCTQSGHAQNGVEVTAGNDWIDGCSQWAYLTDPTDADWWEHPLLSGEEDVQSLIEVSPPSGGGSVEISVVGRIAKRDQYRAISAEISAISLAEFVRVTELDLRYGSNAVLTGKVYSGGDLSMGPGSDVYKDIHAEGEIVDSGGYECPTFHDGAEAFDGEQNNCGAGDIREVYPDPLDFTNFWDDLARIQNVACGGSGLCLDDGAQAYMIAPYVSGGTAKLRIWTSNNPPGNHSSCSGMSAEERWWFQQPGDSSTWTLRGTYDLPTAGVIWADGHVLVGNRSFGQAPVIKGGMTIMAGTAASPKNIIMNTEWDYTGPDTFDVLGLIGTDEFIINPYAVGEDGNDKLVIRAALLGQDGKWRIPYWCGEDSGNNIRFYSNGNLKNGGSGYYGELEVVGSIATPATGSASGSFDPRTYGFDPRFEYLRPPFYPLVSPDWSYENWSEDDVPAWAKS
jgi:hypothetical protein